MQNSEEVREGIAQILKLLSGGGSMRLAIDGRVLSAGFESSEEEARTFAHQHGAAFTEAKEGEVVGYFSRAYAT